MPAWAGTCNQIGNYGHHWTFILTEATGRVPPIAPRFCQWGLYMLSIPLMDFKGGILPRAPPSSSAGHRVQFMKPIRKAIFPVAGLGTRFLPATKAMPKEMLPVVDRPLIQYVVDEARHAGIEHFMFRTGRNYSVIDS